jgi:ABC-type proline/glycine betaine transport system permease subunit
MSHILPPLPASFLPHLLAGMARDLEMAGMALGMGLMLGVPLGVVWAMRSPLRVVPNVIVQLLRAAPTFVVMFFLLNILPHDIRVLGEPLTITREFTVALSLVPYSASILAENGAEALRQWRAGSVLAALLFLPNLARTYFVLVMSSASAAAIGVPEGIAVILRQADQFPSVSDRLWVFAIGVGVYGLILQTGFLLVMELRRFLAHRVTRRVVATFQEEQ